MSTATPEVESGAFKFSDFISSGVDPRTGTYSTTISLAGWTANSGCGPHIPLALSFNCFQALDSGWGAGWSLSLSAYNQKTNRLTLASGISYRVYIADGKVVVKDKKLENTRLTLRGDRLIVSHKDGMVEELTRPDESYDEWLPERVYSNEGRWVSLAYTLVGGRLVLREVRDQFHRAVVLEYGLEDAPPSITLWPDHPQRRIRFSFFLSNGWLREINLSHASNERLTWSFDYQPLNGFLVMTHASTPSGCSETIEYKAQGHQVPPGAPITTVPAVSRSTLAPGQGLPSITRDYEYSVSNFLGYLSGMAWSQDGDSLYDHTGTYTYSSTERLVTLNAGEAREESRIERTYNRFHLMLSQTSIAKGKSQHKSFTYHDVDGLDFYQQPANFQMQRSAAVTYQDSASSTATRTEITHTTYDQFGNLLEQVNPSGAREVYVYYPAEGADGCPANELGFKSALKQRSVIAAPDFASAPTVTVFFTYLDMPSLRDGGHRFLSPATEMLFERGNEEPLVDTRFDYIDEASHAFYGRLKRRTLIQHAGDNRLEFEYSIDGDSVRTHQQLQVAGLTYDCDAWHERFSGNEVKTRDGAGNEFSTQYDSLNRVIKETAAAAGVNPASRTTSFELGNAPGALGGLVVHTTSVRGVSSQCWVDGLGRKTRLELQDVDSPGKPMRLTYAAHYDHLGQLLSETHTDWFEGEPAVSTTSFAHDDWGRVCKTVGPDGVAVNDVFDPVALIRTRWTAGGGKTRTVLNVFGKPEREERIDSQGALSVIARFTYDGLGRCLSRTNEAGFATGFRYDVFGRVVETILPDGTSIKKNYSPCSTQDYPLDIRANDYVLGSLAYDGLMRITRSTVGDRTEQLSYESWQTQPSQRITAAGEVIKFAFDPLLNGVINSREGSHAALSARYRFDPRTAQLIETANPVVQHRVDYFASGNVKTQEWVASAGSYRTSNTCSLNGLLTRFVDVNNLETTYDYDRAARPVRVEQGPVSAHYTYGPRGDLLALSVRDSASQRSQTTRLVHDDFGREIKRSSLLSDGSELLIEQVFGADDKLRQRSLTHDGSTRTETFAYDNRARLVRYDCEGTARPVDPWGKRINSQHYNYDYLDNLLTVLTAFDGGEDLCTFAYERADKTQISSLTHSHGDYQPQAVSFEYDGNGNLLNDEQGRHFKYDALSRLASVSSIADTHYGFDAEDRLHSVSSESGEWGRQFYKGDALCSEVDGRQRRSLLACGGQVLAEQQGDSTVLFVTDGQGTALKRVSAEDESVLSHAPYGHRAITGGLGGLLGFQGERLDPATGCYLLGKGYRPYNPQLMRFHSPDSWSPFGGGGLNAYAYCQGDPINFKDPSGHISVWGWVKIGVTALLAAAAVALTVVTLGAAAPLAGLSIAGVAYLTLEVVSGVVSVAAAVTSELAPDSTASQVLTYASLALGVVSLGATTLATAGSKGIGFALTKSVNSLSSVSAAQRTVQRAAEGGGMYARASVIAAAARQTLNLQSKLNHVLTAKTLISGLGATKTGVVVAAQSEELAIEADKRLREVWPSAADAVSLQEVRKEVLGAWEDLARQVGRKAMALRIE